MMNNEPRISIVKAFTFAFAVTVLSTLTLIAISAAVSIVLHW